MTSFKDIRMSLPKWKNGRGFIGPAPAEPGTGGMLGWSLIKSGLLAEASFLIRQDRASVRFATKSISAKHALLQTEKMGLRMIARGVVFPVWFCGEWSSGGFSRRPRFVTKEDWYAGTSLSDTGKA
jgi:hypothetical protein